MSHSKTRVFISGYYGFGNTGDEAILASIIEHLRAVQPDVAIHVASGNPAQTEKQHCIDAIFGKNLIAVLEGIRFSDLVIIGGGGLFHDYWGIDPGLFLTDQQWGISYYAAAAVFATLLHKPLMLYG